MMEKQKNWKVTIPMKDGSVTELHVTRNDMVAWLVDNGKQQLIDQDEKKLLENYSHAYQLAYNHAHKSDKPRGPRGGARTGAGRKPKGGTEKLHYGWRVSRDVWDILQQQENKTEYIEKAIRAYHRAYGNS